LAHVSSSLHLHLAPFAKVRFLASSDALRPASMVVVHPSPQSGGNRDTGLTVSRIQATNVHWFCYADGCQFRISGSGDFVEAYRPPDMSVDDILVYLLGPIMGFVLRLHGIVSLHASAICLGGRAAAFVGAGGAGKSTLAARFALSGRPVVTDDVLPLEESDSGFSVRPSVPHIKLWPQSVRHLYGRPDALPKLVPSSKDWDKRFLDLTQPGMVLAEGRPPLGALYLLQPRSTTIAVPRIEPVSPADALVAVITHSYANNVLSKEMRQHDFAVLSRLVKAVPVRRLILPETIGELGVLTRLLTQDMARNTQFVGEG
jgi:hypothetical protein